MRSIRGAAFLLASALLVACSPVSDAASQRNADYVRQFTALYDQRQAAYDKAFEALGSTLPDAASPEQLQRLFTALAKADYDFIHGLGQVNPTGTTDSVCESGSFNWKIPFPINDCPDVAALWRVGDSLASDEQAIADADVNQQASADRERADISRATAELDHWRAAANKVRQDIGLPQQSFDSFSVCVAFTIC